MADIAGDCRILRERLGTFQIGTIVCAHVLEHVRQPWIAARNIERLLADGLLFIQVPWVQAYHPIPEDYWRLSLSGVAALFENVAFDASIIAAGPATASTPPWPAIASWSEAPPRRSRRDTLHVVLLAEKIHGLSKIWAERPCHCLAATCPSPSLT